MNRCQLFPVFFSAAMALIGCRDSSPSTTNVDAAPMEGSVDSAVVPYDPNITVYQLQDDGLAAGSAVNLHSVVITAIDGFGKRKGSIYVQETNGGEFSGVLVYLSDGAPAGLAVGDLVDVEGGIKDEFALSDDKTGRKYTEISAPRDGSITVTKVGTAELPEPPVVNAWDLVDDDEAEKWEGVPVTVKGVRALQPAYGVSKSDPTLLEMSITGPFRIGGSLTQLDVKAEAGHCYASITGIGDYFFNYKLLPRSAEDMVEDATGASCLPPEDSDGLCSDELDNDYNGFSDCSDFSCQQSVASCTTDTTVVAAQKGENAEAARIRLTDVVVTAIAADKKSFWVQDLGGAAAYNGLYVYQPDSAEALPAQVTVGSLVTIAGNLDEFDDELSELTHLEIISAEGTIDVVRTLEESLGTLVADKKYEGVLVRVPGQSIVQTGSLEACKEHCSFTIGTPPVYANDDIFRLKVVKGQCIQDLTGVMHYDVKNNRAVILPFEKQAACPQ